MIILLLKGILINILTNCKKGTIKELRHIIYEIVITLKSLLNLK